MAVEKDIVAISIPFSAGVAMAAYLPSGSISPLFEASAALICTVLTLVLYCRDGRQYASGVLTALFCGMFCAFSARMSILPPKEAHGLPLKALEALLGTVDSLELGGEQSGALIKALVLGQRSGLSRETRMAFSEAGAAHILALSGLHMGVIYGMLSKSLSWLGRGRAAMLLRALVGVAAAGFFALMTGGSPSVVRAFLFISLNEISRLLPGRKRRSLSVFWTAMMIQLIANPLIIKSLSFQLSYLAILSIFTLYPKVEAWYPRSKGRDPMRRIWSAAALTICCQLFTAPLAWLHFHSFPTYFIISNLVALPLAELLIMTAIGAIALQAAGICPEILKSLSDMLAQALIKVLEITASL